MKHLGGATSVGQVKQGKAVNQNLNVVENLNFFTLDFG